MTARRTRVALAAVAYVPLLWNSAGKVSADTKSYLYLDPSRLMARAAYMWDESIGLGTVTHQNLGYLFPMGPYYWLMDRLGVPDWIAQRLWLGTVLFAAGAGVVYLAKVLGWRGRGVGVAAFAYMASPYVIDYAARISAILLPWAGLPWMIAFVALSLRRGGWRWPALFALTVGLVGTVNATSLVLVAIGPLLWIAHEMTSRTQPVRRSLAAIGRVGVSTLGVSLWWVIGLRVQGAYGIGILRYTETYEAVSRTSTVPEILRGLGYWFFYGADKVSPWVGPAKGYTKSFWLIVLSLLIPTLALVAMGALRSAHRRFFALLLVVGVAVSVGGHPYASPTVAGGLFKRFVSTTAGLALRSTPRAVPLVALASAWFLGHGVAVVVERFPRWRIAVPAAAVVLVGVNLPSLFTGSLYTTSLLRSENVPAYWQQAASMMNGGSHDTRVLELPGIDFADYRWGGTVDPITPGLIDRPYVARELVPYGSGFSAELLNSLDRRIQDNVADAAATATVAKMLDVGTIAIRNDMQFERYRTPRPAEMHAFGQSLVSATGSTAIPVGPPTENRSIARLPLIDEHALTASPNQPITSPVELVDIAGRPIVSTRTSSSTLLYGDAEGLVDSATAGLIGSGPLFYAGVSPTDSQLGPGPRQIILTDTARSQARRWGSVRENLGETEVKGLMPLRTDVTDSRLDTVAPETFTEQRGVARVQATAYGNPITYTPEDRAANALDGDVGTAWRVGAFIGVTGQRWETQLQKPVTTDHITLLQPIEGARNRWITKVRLRFDGADATDVDLDDTSRSQPGQTVTFPSRSFTTLSIEIVRDNYGKLPGYRGLDAVGFAEVGITAASPDASPARVDEVVQMPTQTSAPGPNDALSVVMTRIRADRLNPNRSDPELRISRDLTLPADESMTLSGTVRVNTVAPDGAIDAAMALQPRATATKRLRGDVQTRADSAIDGNPATAWQTPIDEPAQTLTLAGTTPITTDHLDLQVFADGRHSVPTTLGVSVDGGAEVLVSVPPIVDTLGDDNHVAAVRVALPTMVAGRRFTIRIAEIRAVVTTDYFSELPASLPVAIAEIGLPGLRSTAAPALPACRDDLLSIDGKPVMIALLGAGVQRQLRSCDGTPLALGAGSHLVRTAIGRNGGLDVDQIVLTSDRRPSEAATAAPTVRVRHPGRVSYDVDIAASAAPYWLELGQSHSTGWHATIDGHDLGAPTVIDGFANGWKLPAGDTAVRVHIEWTPQRAIWIGLFVSALALLMALVLALRGRGGPANVDDLTGSLRHPIGVAAAVSVSFALVAGPAVGVVAALAAVVANRSGHRARKLGALVPGALMAVVAAYVVAKSLRYHLPTDLDWPDQFGPTHVIGWAAVAVAAQLSSAGQFAPQPSGQVAHPREDRSQDGGHPDRPGP